MSTLLLGANGQALPGGLRLLVNWLFLGSVFGLWVAAMFVAHRAWPDQRILGVLTAHLALLAGYHWNWRLLGTERVELDSGTLRITHEAGVFGDTVSLRLADVAAVGVRTPRGMELAVNEVVLRRARVVILSTSRRAYPCGNGLSDTEAEALAQAIRSAVEEERRRTKS
jgi:uncharacterized membrane protein